jgi:hypothetical protein
MRDFQERKRRPGLVAVRLAAAARISAIATTPFVGVELPASTAGGVA